MGARRWAKLSNQRTGTDETLIVTPDLWQWFQDEALSQDRIIDLSSQKAQRAFFSKGADGYGRRVSQNLHELQKALFAKEVLIKWRGCVPLKCCVVVDRTTQEEIVPLAEILPPAICEALAAGLLAAPSPASVQPPPPPTAPGGAQLRGQQGAQQP